MGHVGTDPLGEGGPVTFLEFCRTHGVVIDRLPPVGVWRRFRTTDKGSRRNGAVKFMGDHGFVQNWATMTAPSDWQVDGPSSTVDPRLVRRAAQEAAQDHARAAEKAQSILGQCKTQTHAYLAAKGFADEVGNVWERNTRLLVIPMRIGARLVGCQLIDEAGGKRFLSGQRRQRRVRVRQWRWAAHPVRGLRHGAVGPACAAQPQAPLHAARVLLGREHGEGRGRVAARRGARRPRRQRHRRAHSARDRLAVLDERRVGEDTNDFHRRAGLFTLAQQLAGLLRGAPP